MYSNKDENRLRIDLILREPLKKFEEYLNTIDYEQKFALDNFRNIQMLLSDRDNKELKDIFEDPNYVFTDGTKVNKGVYNKDDYEDIFEELLRRHYLDLKYDFNHIYTNIIKPAQDNGSSVFFGDSKLAVDIITHNKIDLPNKEELFYMNKLREINMNTIRLDRAEEDINESLKHIINDRDIINQRPRRVIRDLTYHRKYLKIKNIDLSDELKSKLDLPKDEKAPLFEGGNILVKYYIQFAMSIYKHIIKKGWLVYFDSTSNLDVFSSIIFELIYELMLLNDIQKIKKGENILNEKFKVGDLVLFGSDTMSNSLSKVTFRKGSKGYSDISSIRDVDESIEGRLILDVNMGMPARISKISPDGKSIEFTPYPLHTSNMRKTDAERTRALGELYNLGVPEACAKKLKSGKFDVNYENIIPNSYLDTMKILLPAKDIEPFVHPPNIGINLIIKKFESDFNPVPWLVGDIDKRFREKGVYHRN